MGWIGVFVIVRDDCWLLKPVSRTPGKRPSLSFSHTHTVDPMTHLDAKQQFKLSQTSTIFNYLEKKKSQWNQKAKFRPNAAPVIEK